MRDLGEIMKIFKIVSKGDKKNIFVKSQEKKDFKTGDEVIIEQENDKIAGKIDYSIDTDNKKINTHGLILRKVNSKDQENLKQIKKEEKRATKLFKQKTKVFKLGMKLIDCEMSFDKKNITFYFFSETRVDFRDLLRDLVRILRKMIRLQQVGPRDEAKMMKGLGPCGRGLCCQTFLPHLESITTDLAKVQNLESVASSKISGNCGKLFCCLSFEAEQYKQLVKKLPKAGDQIKTKKGLGKVIDQDILNQKVTVELAKGQKIKIKYDKK